MRKLLFIISFMVLASAAVAAEVKDYSKYYKIDLNEKLPPMEELEAKYMKKGTRIYERRYDYHWDMGNTFDKVFALTIRAYGSSDKRVKHEYEDSLIKALKSLPKETYQYIGPLLHIVPNMPEKVLNMPGIKETKNKFPDRIAPQLADMEGIEFLSPHFYFLLMPEAWPENEEPIEYVKKPRPKVKVEYNPHLMDNVKKLVPAEDFIPGRQKVEKVSDSDLRTLVVTEDSPITSADIKAFANTLDRVKKFGDQPRYAFDLVKAGMLIDMYEVANGTPPLVGHLKDMASPCKRLVQKIRLLGREDEFQLVIGEDGFDLNSWAYTCDKTMNAYRVATVRTPTAMAIKSYRKGVFGDIGNLMGRENAEQHMIVMQSVLDMYEAPMNDVIEAQKNKTLLYNKFRDLEFNIVSGTPITTY